MLSSKHVSKLARICQPPSGQTAVLTKEGLSEGCLRPSLLQLEKPILPVGTRGSCLYGGHHVDVDGWKAWLVHLLYGEKGGTLASWTQEVLASCFLTTPGDCALFHGPWRGQEGGVCLLYLPSNPDPPSPHNPTSFRLKSASQLRPILSLLQRRLNRQPCCGQWLCVTDLPFHPVKGLEATVVSSLLLVPCVWRICAFPAACLFPHLA